MKRFLAILILGISALAARAEDQAEQRPLAPPVQETIQDPVCQMTIHKSKSPFHESCGEKEFWFCSSNCHQLFMADPARFAGAKAAAEEGARRSETEKPSGPDESAMRNSEWRGLLHSAQQVREAAMTIMVLAVTFFSALVLGGLILFTSGLAPNAVARSSVATRDHPIRSFAIGAVALIMGSGATIATKGLLGIIVAPVLTSALFIGLAGVSEHLGRNLFHLAGKEGNRVGHLCAGWTTFSLVSIVPLVGWFGFLPYYGAVGVGAFFSSLMGGGKRLADGNGRV